MIFKNQSAGEASRKFKGAAQAGQENPATAQQVELGYSRRSSSTMPTAAMAGTLSRKFPETPRAGQDVAGRSQNAKVMTRSYGKLTQSMGGKSVKV